MAEVSRRRGWVELGVGYGLIVTVIWMPRHWQRYPYWAAIAWIAAVSAMSFPGWDGWGMRARGFGRGLIHISLKWDRWAASSSAAGTGALPAAIQPCEAGEHLRAAANKGRAPLGRVAWCRRTGLNCRPRHYQ